jgi:cystathionine gamma-lyase
MTMLAPSFAHLKAISRPIPRLAPVIKIVFPDKVFIVYPLSLNIKRSAMLEKKKLSFATRCIHAGQKPDKETGAIMTPIYLSSTYVQEAPGQHKGYEYSRTQNPTRKALEENLASLESGKHGFAFASGCAATTTLLMGLETGDHIVAIDDLYGGTFRLFDKVFSKMGISTSFCNLADAKELEIAIRPSTKLIWVETPTNPMLKLVDIAAICEIAKRMRVKVAVDNTFATPALQKPLHLGADFAVHSTTKYLGGHSDVVGGAIITSDDEWAERLRFLSNAIGAIPSPMDCFLVLRGIKTLDVRMERHTANATEIAEFLESHPYVERVIYPGLKSHKHFELCRRQMRSPGGMLSFVIKGGLNSAVEFLRHTSIFSCAESLGGVESLIEHPAIMTHASVPPSIRKALGIDDGLIRISAGIEDSSDLIDDLSYAFSKVGG